jgi:hypothetical protein
MTPTILELGPLFHVDIDPLRRGATDCDKQYEVDESSRITLVGDAENMHIIGHRAVSSLSLQTNRR